jgi:hypothetical protein
MYALGVRTARKRGAQSALGTDARPVADDVHVPPTPSSLHAPSLEREVPLSTPRERIADLLDEAVPTPPVRRTSSVDDLFRRD